MATRRRNKSSKVPNVKLRPPAPSTRQLQPSEPSSSRSLHPHDSGFDSEYDTSLTDIRVPRPFRGVILTATGISDKTTIFKQAIELGAQPFNDLTDQVTHLLALGPGSAKYSCALENGIPIMHPSWISDSYQVWLRGDDVKLAETIQIYRLPIFQDVVICISGIEDVQKRTDINRLVTEQGGRYVKNIERPVRVTHLLCTTGIDNMTEKMRYAAKFNQQKESNIHMVWEDWFWHSLRAQGRFEEDIYDISKPRPMRSSSPEYAPALLHSSISAIQTDDAGSKSLDNYENDDEVATAVKRAPAITLQIWKSMLHPRGFDLQQGRLVRSPSKTQGSRPKAMEGGNSPNPRLQTARNALEIVSSNPPSRVRGEEGTSGKQTSTLASVRRSRSFLPQVSDAPTLLIRPFIKASTVRDERINDDAHPIPSPCSGESSLEAPLVAPQKQQLFSDTTFRLLGEARSASVKAALEDVGGRIITDDIDVLPDFIIVRLVSGSKLFQEEVDEVRQSRYRTECWLERCIFEERICAPDEHVSFTPLKMALPLPGAGELRLSVSGLDESELCWIRRLSRALGINVLPTFSRHSTHLLCPSRDGAKYNKAQHWNIPVVDMSWFTKIATSGQIPGVEGFVSDNKYIHKASDTPCRSGELAPDEQADTLAINRIQDHDYVLSPTKDELFGPPFLLVDSRDSLPVQPRTPCKKTSYDRSDVVEQSSNVNNLQRQPTLSLDELREDMQNTRIPSSETPSPIKMVSISHTPNKTPSRGGRSASNTPVKISKEATKVLQESITSLLGKRNSIEDGVGRPKRMKPAPRLKPQAQSPAERFEAERSQPKSSPRLRRSSMLPMPSPSYEPFGDAETSMLMAEDELGECDAMHVMYEDPAENTERTRLMKLLEPEGQVEVRHLGETADSCLLQETSAVGHNLVASSKGSTTKRKAPPRKASARRAVTSRAH